MPFDSYANLQSTVLDWLARPSDPLVAPAVPDMIQLFEEEARDRLQTRFTEKIAQLIPDPVSGLMPLPDDYGEVRSIRVQTASGKRHLQYQTPPNLDFNLRLYYTDNYPAAFTIEGTNVRIVGTSQPSMNGGAAGSSVITLTPAASSTIYQNPVITPTSFIGLMPDTANAADALASVWIVPGTGSAVIHHASSPNADQTFTVTLFDTAAPVDTTQLGPINLHYLSGIPPLGPSMPTNWLLTQYPSAYLWGTLVNAAPYIGDDPRLQIWLGAREAAIERIRLADRRAKFPHGLMIQTDVRNP